MFRNTFIALFGMAALATLAGCPAPVPPDPVVPTSAEVKSFTASATTVAPGAEVTLSWETAGAKSISLTTQSGEAVDVSSADVAKGSVVVKPTDHTLYVLTARGEGGSDSASVPVAIEKPSEEFFFAVFPREVTAGEDVSIVWNVPGAQTVHVEDAAGNLVFDGATASGSKVLRPNFSTTYTIAAQGEERAIDVTVGPAVLAFVSAAPSVTPEGTITLSWKAGGATEVTLESEGRGVLHTASTQAEITDGTFSEPVPAIVSDHSGLVHYRLVAHNGDTEASKEVTVYTGVDPMISEFTVPEYAKLGASFEVSWKTLEAETVHVLVDGVEVYVTHDSARAAQGTATVGSPTKDADVILVAENSRGGTVTETRPVKPVGGLVNPTFTVDVPVLAQGGLPAELSWNVENARHIRVYDVGSGRILEEKFGEAAETGTRIVYPNKLTTYALFAENLVGDALTPELTVNVDVTTPATLIFNPPTAPIGASVQVTGTTVPGGGAISGLPTFQKNAPGEAFVDISTTGVDTNYSGPDTTAAEETMTEPFYATLFGQRVGGDEITTSINGWFAFGSSGVYVDAPEPFPTTALEPFTMAPFFEDLYDVSGEIYYQIDTVGTEKRLIVQWDDVEYDPVAGSLLTFQVQLYESGKVVFAYGSVQDAAGANPTIGIINGDETAAVVAPPGVPADGDTYTFFGQTSLPASIIASTSPFVVRQSVGNDYIEIESSYPVIPPDQFKVTEVMTTPAAGVTDGQWIEVTNQTAAPVDLNGWSLYDGAGGEHVINQSVVIPANGSVVLAQSANAGDGVNVDYVFGSGFSLPTTPGSSFSIGKVNAAYTSITLPNVSVVPGYSIQVGAPNNDPIILVDSGVTEIVCTADGSTASEFGTHGQHGTPGTPNTVCPGYTYAGKQTLTAFESIASTGTQIIPSGDENESIDEITLPVPVRYGGLQSSHLWVSTNGFVSLKPVSCFSSTDCSYSNNTTLDPSQPDSGVVAPFWDDLRTNTGGGIYWERKVPGLAPNDGYTLVSWENVRYDSTTITSTYNFQVKFYDTGDIELILGSMTSSTASYAKGTSATTWLEDPSGLIAYEVNTNSSTVPGVTPMSIYRFEW